MIDCVSVMNLRGISKLELRLKDYAGSKMLLKTSYTATLLSQINLNTLNVVISLHRQWIFWLKSLLQSFSFLDTEV